MGQVFGMNAPMETTSSFADLQLGQKRAAIYARVSTLDQSCARQESELLAYAARANYHVVGIWKETSSGAKDIRPGRQAVVALAQSRKIDVILVSELTRWGRSTLDLLRSLQDLQAVNVSMIAQSGLQFDLTTPQGKLFASMMAALAEFERDLLRERVRSGMAAAKARGVRLGRRVGQRVKADKLDPKVLVLVDDGKSYRQISQELRISKNTVYDIVRRNRIERKIVPMPVTNMV
jgi:putative DNA-invertase from lambdoid prophage Rac